MLIGEELRRDIATKSGIVSERPPLGYTWPDIHFSYNDDSELNSFVDIPFSAPGKEDSNTEKMEAGRVNESDEESQAKMSKEDDSSLSQLNNIKADAAPVSFEGTLKLKQPQDNENAVASSSDDSEGYYSDDYELCFMSDSEKERRTRKRKKKTSPPPDQSLFIPKSCVHEYLKKVNTSPEDIGPGPEVLLQVSRLYS